MYVTYEMRRESLRMALQMCTGKDKDEEVIDRASKFLKFLITPEEKE